MSASLPLLCGSLAVLAMSAVSWAQDAGAAETQAGQIQFSVTGGFEQQFESSVEGGGDLEVLRYRLGINATSHVSESLDVGVSFAYNLDSYDFVSAARLGGDPWDDIHTATLGAQLTTHLNSQWSVFGGPVIQSAREDGADWQDGLIAGGYVGAIHRASEKLVISLGFGVVSQIEDSARFFPVIAGRWQLSPDLRLQSTTGIDASGRTGLEIVCDLGDGWEAALGGAYQFRRFRLDKTNAFAPDGAAEETSIPFWLRLSRHMSENLAIDLYGGFATFGQFDVENSSGVNIATADYDPGAIAGVSVKIRF